MASQQLWEWKSLLQIKWISIGVHKGTKIRKSRFFCTSPWGMSADKPRTVTSLPSPWSMDAATGVKIPLKPAYNPRNCAVWPPQVAWILILSDYLFSPKTDASPVNSLVKTVRLKKNIWFAWPTKTKPLTFKIYSQMRNYNACAMDWALTVKPWSPPAWSGRTQSNCVLS